MTNTIKSLPTIITTKPVEDTKATHGDRQQTRKNMNGQDPIEQIASSLESENVTDQTRGLQRVQQMTLEESHVSRLVPHIADLVGSKNAYIHHSASTALENLIKEYPATVAEKSHKLVDSLSLDDKVSAHLVGTLVDQLQDRPDFDPEVSVDTAYGLIQSDHRPARKAGYFFLGRSKAPRAAEYLVEGIEVNIGEVESAAQAALNQYREWAVHSTRQNTDEAPIAAQALRRLAKADPSYLESEIENLVRAFDENPYHELRQLFVSLLIHDTVVAETVHEAMLENVPTTAPENLASQVRAQATLEILVEVESSALPYRAIVDCCRELATVDDPTLREHAVVQLETLGRYNATDDLGRLLRTLAYFYDDENETVRDRARETYDHVLDHPAKLLRHGLAPLGEMRDQAKINVLANVLHRFAYRDDPEGNLRGRVVFRDALQYTLNKVVNRFESSQNTPIIWPAYEPEAVVLLALALAIERADEGATIALFTPGTKTQWGLLGEVRAAYDRYGIRRTASHGVVPLSEILPHARIKDGQVVPASEGNLPCTVVLTKDLGELATLSTVDAVVFHYAAHTKPEYGDHAGELVSEWTETTFFPTYSLYTKHETEGYPRYGPPDGLEDVETLPSTRAIDSAVADSVINDKETTPDITFDYDVSQLVAPKRIRVREVHGPDHGRLLTDLERAYEASADLRKKQLFGPANRIFSLHLFFERLSVPGAIHDEWVRRRYDQNIPRRFIPDIVQRRIENLEKYGGIVEDHRAVQWIFSAVNYLERVADQLRDTNPLFDELVAIVRAALTEDEHVAVYTPSKSIAMMTQEALEERVSGVSTDALSVVTSDTIRQLDDCDKLVFTGPQRPQEAGYYIHPRVEEVVVLTHDAGWATMVEHHAEEYVHRLNASIGEPGNEPFDVPAVEPEVPTTERDESDEPTVSFESVQPGAPMESSQSPKTTRHESTRISDIDRLKEAFRTATTSEFTESRGHYESTERIKHEILTTSGSRLKQTSNDRVFVKRERKDDTYRWGSPQSLVKGDHIKVIDPIEEAALWKSYLEEMYSDELSDVDAMAQLETWFDTITDITEETAARINVSAKNDILLNYIAEEVQRAGSNRVSGTIVNWFRSVLEARSLIDLARDPDLTIGPRDISDIEVIGEAFDRRELRTNARRIEAAMRAIRHLNRQGGHDFRDELLKQMNANESTQVQMATTAYEVVDVRRIDSNVDEELSDNTSGKTKSSSDGDIAETDTNTETVDATNNTEDVSRDEPAEIIDRVGDLLDLEPTTNGKLAQEWGLDSGKEVYQYISTELADYYYRGPNRKICASDEAEALVNGRDE